MPTSVSACFRVAGLPALAVTKETGIASAKKIPDVLQKFANVPSLKGTGGSKTRTPRYRVVLVLLFEE